MNISHDDCFYLGFISKVHGFKGLMVFFIDADNPFKYSKLKRVLIDINGVLNPFFVETIDIKDKGFAHVKLEGVDDRDTAVSISGKELYLPLSELPPLDDQSYYLHELPGMEVIDEVHGAVGKVEKVYDYSQNTLLQVLNSHHEVLIPLNDQFVARVDKAAKVVHVHIPKELLDINPL